MLRMICCRFAISRSRSGPSRPSRMWPHIVACQFSIACSCRPCASNRWRSATRSSTAQHPSLSGSRCSPGAHWMMCVTPSCLAKTRLSSVRTGPPPGWPEQTHTRQFDSAQWLCIRGCWQGQPQAGRQAQAGWGWGRTFVRFSAVERQSKLDAHRLPAPKPHHQPPTEP